jgi:hypothetical protein
MNILLRAKGRIELVPVQRKGRVVLAHRDELEDEHVRHVQHERPILWTSDETAQAIPHLASRLRRT